MEDFLTGILTWLKQLLSAIGLGGLFGDDKQAAPGAPPDPDAAKKAADAALQAKDKTVGDVDTAAWAILKADKPSPDQISDLKAKAAALNTLLDDPDYQKSLHDTARLNRKGDIQFAYEHVLAAARKADVTLEGKLGAWQANDKAVDEADATARAILKANDPSPDQINDLKAKAAVLNTLLGDQDYQKKRLEDGMDLQDFRNVETDLLDAARKANVTLDGKLGALQAGDKTFTDLKTTIEGINTPGHQLSDEEKATLQSQLDALSALLNADEYIHTLVTEETMDTNGRDRGKTYAAVFMGVSAAAEKAGIALTENMRKKVNFLSEYIVSVAAQRASGNMEPSPDKDKEGFGELLKNVNSILKDKAYMDSLGGADSDERKAFDAKIKCITDAAKAAGIDLKEYDKLAAYAPSAPSKEPPPPQPPSPAPAAPAIDQNNLKAKLETIYTANLDPAAESVFNNYGGDRGKFDAFKTAAREAFIKYAMQEINADKTLLNTPDQLAEKVFNDMKADTTALFAYTDTVLGSSLKTRDQLIEIAHDAVFPGMKDGFNGAKDDLNKIVNPPAPPLGDRPITPDGAATPGGTHYFTKVGEKEVEVQFTLSDDKTKIIAATADGKKLTNDVLIVGATTNTKGEVNRTSPLNLEATEQKIAEGNLQAPPGLPIKITPPDKGKSPS